MLILINTVMGANEIIDIQMDKNFYSPGENITINGVLYQSTEVLSLANVTLTFNGADYNATTDINGTFSTIINAPDKGIYNLLVSYGSVELNRTINIRTVTDVQIAIIESGVNSYKYIEFLEDKAFVGITDSGSIEGNLTYANFTYNGTTFYAILQKEDEIFDSAFVSSTPDFSSIKYQYLTKNSKLTLKNDEFTIFHIDPEGKRALMVKAIEPVFYTSTTKNLMILALDSKGSLQENITWLDIMHVDSNGNELDINTDIESGDDIRIDQLISNKRIYGLKIQTVNISDNGGKHDLIVGGMGHTSYYFKKFNLKTMVQAESGEPVSIVSLGQLVNLKASLIDINLGTQITDATVTATVVSPSGAETELALAKNANNLYVNNFTIASEGKYTIYFDATHLGSKMKNQQIIRSKNINLFMQAFSKERGGEGEGFPLNSYGFLIVGGKDLSANEFINLSDLTTGCDDVVLKGIKDSKYNNKLRNQSSQTLDAMLINESAPIWIQEKMKENFGEKACVIRFLTPEGSGDYKLELSAIISNSTHEIYNYIDVTSLFTYASSVSCETLGWQKSLAPGAVACFEISAYDASTGAKINTVNITDVNLIEVFNPKEGIITDKIKNFTTFTQNGKKVFRFLTSNSSIGHHEVEFKIKANTSKGIGSGAGKTWYRTELWSAWSYPFCDYTNKFCSFGSTSDISLKVEAFSAGFGSGQAGLTASVSSIKNYERNEIIQLDGSDSISCTTIAANESGQNSNSSAKSVLEPATCTLIISQPEGGWNSGGHEVKMKVSDEDGNEMVINSWFSIENFRFFAWNKNWEVTKDQDLQFEVTLQTYDGSNLDADVQATKLYFIGGEGEWREPQEVSFTASPQSISGHGTYVIDKSVLANLKSGYYDMVLAADANGEKQTTRTGFSIKSFIVDAQPINDNWEHAYEIEGNLTINISGFMNRTWSWPYTGAPHNISNVTIKRINKNGMWDSPYLEGEAEMVGLNVTCFENNCLLKMPLNSFEQGSYDAELVISDQNGNTARAYYWFKTEIFTITTPDIQDWRTIPSGNKMSDKMEIIIGTDRKCGSGSDQVVEPVNVTNCNVEEVFLPTIHRKWDFQQKNTVILLDKTNSSALKIYVNSENYTWLNNSEAHFNFRQESTQEIIVGGNFTDANGYIWQVISIDLGDNSIKLKSKDGVIRTLVNMAGESNSETEVEYLYQYILDKSLSKSGTFLYSGNGENEEKFWDEEWGKIDLDADGKYNCNADENGTWNCEEYYMILTDKEQSGKYDTLLISETRNMTTGVNSYDGLSGSGSGDIRLNLSADPIYLLNIIYIETNGIGSYRLVTTTNTPGRAGRHMGVFELGNNIIKIPVMIVSPSSKEGLAGKDVQINKLRTHGYTKEYSEISLVNPANGTTGSNGIAILSLNISGIKSGEYMIQIDVNDSGSLVSNANEWDNPKIDLRSFMISSLLGIKHTISNVVEWSTENNNLFKKDSTEARIQGSGITESRIVCREWDNEFNDPNICHFDDWRYRALWINLTNMELIVDNTPDDWNLKIGDINTTISSNDIVSIKNEFGQTESFTFLNGTGDLGQLVINNNETVKFNQIGSPCKFSITVNNLSLADGGRLVWDVKEECPYGQPWNIEQQTHTLDEKEFLWGYFNISDLTVDNVTLNILVKKAFLRPNIPEEIINDLEQGSDGRLRVVANIENTGFDLYVYNSNQSKTISDLNGWSDSLDAVLLVNSTNISEMTKYAFGEIIPLIGKAVVSAEPYQRYVYLSNLTIDDKVIYPLPWSCDEKKFYVGSFTEEELGFKLGDCFEAQGQPLSNVTNYLVMFDSKCDGTWELTSATLDDDPIMYDRWAEINGTWTPYDFTGPEEGTQAVCDYNSYNSNEKWIELGRESWPISITKHEDKDLGQIDLFKTKWGIEPTENITDLNLWVQAKNFDGTSMDGNITLEGAKGTSWSCGMMQEEEINVTTSDGSLTNGIGYLNLNLSNVTVPEPTLKFKVLDLAYSMRFEFVSKMFWYGPGQNFNEKETCDNVLYPEPITSGGSSGGGGGYYEEPYFDFESDICLEINQTLSCGSTNGCAWTTTNNLDEEELFMIEQITNVTSEMCLPCPVFDGNETACLAYSSTCMWIADEEMGLCDPIY